MHNKELDSVFSDIHEHTLMDQSQGDGVVSALNFGPKGLIVLLHGWDMDKNYDPGILFRPFVERVRQQFEPSGYLVFAPTYNTHESFVWAAKNLYQLIVHSKWPLNNVHVFGYSMGGLVARQMVVEGLAPRNLVTYCTPNCGTAAWISNTALFNNGAMSMASWSEDLKRLNNHPRDQQCRDRYHTIGLSYFADNQKTQRHDNDAIVEVTSAIMWGVNPKPAGQIHWSSYRVWGAGRPLGDPHAQAQSFPEAQSAFNFFCDLVKKTA